MSVSNVRGCRRAHRRKQAANAPIGCHVSGGGRMARRLRCGGLIMSSLSYPRALHVLPILLLTASLAHPGELRPFEHHVRTTDPHLRALIRHGVDTSPTFNTLVDQLTRTDIIVIVVPGQMAEPNLDGELTFMVKAGGMRYLKVELACDRHPRQLLAAIAHELQHAAEIAGFPAIVDDESMARAYAQFIGYEKTPHRGRRRFDSQAAIDAGRQVWKEASGD